MRGFYRKLLLVFAVITACALAQINQGSISGNVLDPSGAVVSGAKITATGTATGSKYQTVSTSAGAFRISSMSPGSYDVTVSAIGFKSAIEKGVVVQVGTISALDVKLETGVVSESVSVEADAPSIQTESSEVGTVVTAKQVLDLPLALGSVVQAMRSPEAFVFLTPGTTGPGTSSGAGGTFESKISGSQTYATEVQLDGASTFRSENGSSFDETAPSVEALGEFKITTSTLPADLGRTTGGIESFSTKTGTNSVHGSAYEIFRNEDLNANSFFNNHQLSQLTDPAARQGFQRPKDRQNDYGLTFGGPVWIPKLYNGRDKTFFFFSWEQYREAQGGVTNSRVPTALERQGIFTETLNTANVLGTNACDGTPVYQGQIFDPATARTVGSVQCRTAFPGNIIPQNRFSTVANNLLPFFPGPQNTSLNINFSFPFSFPILDTTTTFRFDHNLTSRQKLYFSYSSRDNVRVSNLPFGPNPATEGRNQSFSTHYFRTGWDFAITPTLLSHLNLGYNRTNSKNVGAGVTAGVDWAAQLGITGTTGLKGVFPQFNFGGFNAVHGLGDNVNGDTIDNGYRLNYDLTWIKGKHNLKAGIDYRLQIYSPLDFSNTSGTYNFQTQETNQGTNISSGLAGNGLASFLLGQVDQGNLTNTAGQPRWISPYYGFYIQDTYKVSRTLTVNLGLRWDADIPRRAKDGNTSNISLITPNPGADGYLGALVFAGKGPGRNGNVNEHWANPYYKDFGPRVGFAWSPESLPKTVIRGGYGLFYGPLVYADFGGFNRAGFKSIPAFQSFDGFSPAFNLDSGFPAYTPPPNFDPAQLNGQGPQYIDPSYGRPAAINNWSLEVQHELAQDFIFSIAYVGQHSTHLRTNFNAVNSITPDKLQLGGLLRAATNSPAAVAAGIQLPYASFNPGNSVAQALVPFPQYGGFNTDGALENLGQSTYHALEISGRRRFHNGLNLLVSYTWSKTLTDADSALPFFATLHGGGSAQNPFNKRGEKAISNQDVPHTFVVSYVYELPFGKGKKFLGGGNGITNKVVSGWSVSGIQRYQSGQPFSFCCATGVPGFAGAIRFNRVAGQPLASKAYSNGPFNPFTDSLFNPAAFSDPNAGIGLDTNGNPVGGPYSFGNQTRTTGEVRSFVYLSEDFNLIKRTPITEHTNFVIQASFLDAFNRHIFNRPPDLNPTSRNFGILDTNNTLLGPRKIQLQLRVEF